MDMRNIKLIALDLDGTLLNSNKELTERNLRSLERAAQAGIEIVPTTGRFFDGMPQAVRDLPFLHYAITINGAQVQDIRTGEVIYRAELPLVQAISIMESLDTLPVIYDCYQDNWGWMTRSMQERAAEYAPDAHYLGMLRTLREPVDELKDFLRRKGKDVQKIQFFAKDLSIRDEVLRTYEARFPGTKVSSSVVNNVEINAAGANKGDAIRALAGHTGITMEQTMSFGDGINDLSMISACGVGVAMEKACDEVKRAASIIAPSCDEDGVSVIIEELLFGKRQDIPV